MRSLVNSGYLKYRAHSPLLNIQESCVSKTKNWGFEHSSPYVRIYNFCFHPVSDNIGPDVTSASLWVDEDDRR